MSSKLSNPERGVQTLCDVALGERNVLSTNAAGNVWGEAASSEDFEHALGAVPRGANAASEKRRQRKNNAKLLTNANTLDNLFNTWVYGIAAGKTKSSKALGPAVNRVRYPLRRLRPQI